MLVKAGGKFNLWDTNGRRGDILNALTIYLTTLDELDKEYPNEKWGRYPQSIKQFEFYKRAVEKSSDVFKQHGSLDRIQELINQNKVAFYNKDENFAASIGLMPYKATNPMWKDFDVNVESRARHYTANLVKYGFTNNSREITPVGREFLLSKTKKDVLESILPIDDINIVLLRQLLRLRVFEELPNGNYSFYNPALYCMKLLLSDDDYNRSALFTEILTQGKDGTALKTPDTFLTNENVGEEEFGRYINSRKSRDKTQDEYYLFYLALRDFVDNRSQKKYDNLVSLYEECDKKSINGAFLMCEPLVFNKKGILSLSEFLKENENSKWLDKEIEFNKFFYEQHIASKADRLLSEYGDTLFRMLTATGVFSFGKLPELLYKEFFTALLSSVNIDEYIFGEVSEEKFNEYEDCFGQTQSLSSIFDLSSTQVNEVIEKLQEIYSNDVKAMLSDEKSKKLAEHIRNKYPKDKVIELLQYFSDRNNDSKIQSFVNPATDVPTIYEYVVAIAWYYISDRNYSLFNSLNLTLDGNCEPMHHAGGGMGDIVVEYPDEVIMLEVTLMNKMAQKRGEWEPVLRHSINIKAENEHKRVTTLFVADELDTNTINIWRAVASVPLEASNSEAETDHVYIMPFTNKDICDFMIANIQSEKIINSVRESYDSINYSFDREWRNKVLQSISA